MMDEKAAVTLHDAGGLDLVAEQYPLLLEDSPKTDAGGPEGPWCPEQDSNLHAPKEQAGLSRPCLPFHHPGPLGG